VDRELRRHLLKPLNRRRRHFANHKALVAALERLDQRALGESLLPEVRELISKEQDERRARRWKDSESVQKSVAVAKALYHARRISSEEYVFYADLPIEEIHMARSSEGYYADARPVLDAIRRIESEHGLPDDEYWLVGQGPPEYERLQEQHSALLEEKYAETLREFGLDDLADLRERNPEEYARRRERGRRASFHKEEYSLAVQDVVVRYEEDARRAAAAGAYSAAVTALGAGIEGLLLLRCLRSKKKASECAQRLTKRLRPRYPGDLSTWSFETLIEVCLAARWLPPVRTALAQYDTARLAHLLRLTRNHVHPARRAKERPWSETDERDFKDAEAIYLVLLARLVHIRRRTVLTSQERSGTPAK